MLGTMHIWHLDHDDSVLAEQRAAGPPLRDFPERFAAQTIGPGHAPLEAVADVRLGGAPLLWLPPERDAVVVDDRWLSDVDVADVTKTLAAERLVATLTPAARGRLDVVAWTDWLVRSGALLTYWHLEATLRLDAFGHAGGVQHARLSGSHVYMTMERNEDTFAFEVRLSPEGRLTVQTCSG